MRTREYVFNIFAVAKAFTSLDVENRPNGLTINIFIGRQVGTGIHKSD